MGTIASQITSLTIVYSTVYSGADQSKHQSSASLAFVWGIHRGPVNSPHKWPVTRKMFPFDDVIMRFEKDRSPLLVVFLFGLFDHVLYVALLNLNRSWRHSASIWWNDLYVSIINSFSRYRVKKKTNFSEIVLPTLIQMCHGVCETIVLGFFLIFDYSSFDRSAVLVDSFQSRFLWNY